MKLVDLVRTVSVQPRAVRLVYQLLCVQRLGFWQVGKSKMPELEILVFKTVCVLVLPFAIRTRH